VLELLEAGLPAPARGVFTTRAGGVSLPPWEGLNLARHVDDAHAKVMRNRELLTAQLEVEALVFGKQVHGAGVRVVKGASNKTARGLDDTDGLVTTVPGLALAILGADCLPVLLAADGVVGAAHVGRLGLVKGVLREVVRVMREQGAGCIVATIGPGVCGRCYEVPASMAGEVEKAVPGARSTTRRGTTAVDLVKGATSQLTGEGIAVTTVGGCTLEQPGLFYSFRRDGVTGRHGGVVWLP
jgi:YfiH family protein